MRVDRLKSHRPRRAGSRGFTLTELLIVMGLSGLVVSALLGIAQVQSRNEQQAQQGQAALENARGALEELSQSARAAGMLFGGTQPGNPPGVAYSSANPRLPTQQIFSLYQGGSVNLGDTPMILVQNNAGPDGQDILTLFPAEPGFSGAFNDSAEPAMGVLRSNFTGASPLVVDSQGPASQPWQNLDFVALLPVGFQSLGGGNKRLTDFNAGYLVRLSGAPVAAAPGFNLPITPANGALITLPVSSGSLLFRLRPVTYRINKYFNAGADQPGLLPERTLIAVKDGPFSQSVADCAIAPADCQVVAENIADLQVSLWYDCNEDGQVNEVGLGANDDEILYNAAGDTPFAAGCVPQANARNPLSSTTLPANAQLNPPRISGLRITVVARTSTPLDTLGPGRPRAEDRGADLAPPGDGNFADPTTTPYRYRYRLHSTWVYFRNPALTK